jgi:hypothetical protein
MISTRAAAILGVAAVTAVGLWLYFSPYQQCLREMRGIDGESTPAARCLQIMSTR